MRQVHSCNLQELGLGRPMKAGKESVLGAISAIRNWRGRDWEKTREQQQAVAASLIAKPVSYTHLDVYKRQVLSSGAEK